MNGDRDGNAFGYSVDRLRKARGLGMDLLSLIEQGRQAFKNNNGMVSFSSPT